MDAPGHAPQPLRKAREAGFDLHLVKPVESAVLAKALAELPSVRGPASGG